ncbi:hypothetical protein SLEP1_g25152 [Rubroshorea leprosula]|uniref:F-box domain-containing protein n=1 Tax=Rubroshorea leprosula TaxID=152421 RepID=A0AAV5JU29_9ROSI|nr:hypothetical protein SLEP1_g25152 [Rubroshorea leprosula]
MAFTSVKSEFFGESASMSGVDRISSLPDEAAHHLLGFLDVGDLSHLILVSKRWNSLCMPVPVLTIDNREHASDLASYDRYILMLESFLALRHKARVVVRKFKLTWQFCGEGERKKTRMTRKGNIMLLVISNLTYKLKELAVRTKNITFLSPDHPVCSYTTFQLESLTLESLKLSHTTIGGPAPTYARGWLFLGALG